MPVGQTFDALMAQPGPSATPDAPPDAVGGTMSNSSVEQINMTNPLQQARIRTQTSLNALKRLAATLAQGKA